MRRALLACALLAACDKDEIGDTGVDPAHPVTCPAGREARFDALADVVQTERARLGAPAVSVALMLDGELVWCEGFGEKEPGGDAPTGRTLYRIGSVTKMLTAAALVQEVEAGRLETDATLPSLLGADWQLAAQPGLTDQLTVHHLLTHQGGFVDYLELDSDEALADWVDGWMLDNLYMMAEPGSFYNYSNPGFMVAGRVLEHTSGEPYLERLTDGVLRPLGMDRTVFLPKEVRADGDFAVGRSGGQSIEPGEYDNPWARPAGYAWSSVEDLARFAAFLADGDPEVLSDGLRAEMTARHVDMRSIPGLEHYGYGIMVMDGMFLEDGFHDLDWISHGGAIPGFSAEIHAIPEQGFAFVTLASGDGAYLRDALAEAVASFVDLPAPTQGPDLTPPDPADYVGVYEDPFNVGTMIFTVDDEGALTVEMPRLDQLGIPYEPTLQPMYGDVFLLGVQGFHIDLTFVPDDEGQPRWARTRSFVAEREGPKAMKAVEASPIDAATLRERLLVPPAPPFRPKAIERL